MTIPDAFRALPGGLAAVLLTLAAPPAFAQAVFTASVNSDPDLGNVVAANTGQTIFRFSPDGSVTQLGGGGKRLGAGSVRGVVQIACDGPANSCNGGASRVRIGSIGAPTGKASALSSFTVSIGSNGTITNVIGTDPVEFTLTHKNKANSPLVNFGADVSINSYDGPGAAGPATSGYYVYVAPSPGVPTTGVSGVLRAAVTRPMSLTGTPTLNFGAIIKPRTGSGSVSLIPSTNTRTVSGNGAGGLNAPTPARASYTVTGEGGQAISVSVPGSFTMSSSDGSTINVTLITSGLPTSLSAAPGSEGSASFHVGGTFNISAGMSTGDYSGVYAVTAQHN